MANLITTIRVEKGYAHDTVSVWNRGGLAGILRVCLGDGELVAARLAGPDLDVRIEVFGVNADRKE